MSRDGTVLGARNTLIVFSLHCMCDMVHLAAHAGTEEGLNPKSARKSRRTAATACRIIQEVKSKFKAQETCLLHCMFRAGLKNLVELSKYASISSYKDISPPRCLG